MIHAVILGAGSRGVNGYGRYALAHPDELKISAICDIDAAKTEKYGQLFSVPEKFRFTDSEALFGAGKLGDVIFICTQDRDHFRHASRAMELGYDILLEKPVSPDLGECLELVRLAKKHKRKVVVCHVLRYTAYFGKLKELIDRGTVGKVIGIDEKENVEYWHQCHSFVRGNWRNSRETSPMILQKCCHDFDILYWLCGSECERISSYGRLNWFRKENAPQGAASRCLSGCKAKENCPFDAEKIYIEEFNKLNLSAEAKKTAFPYSQVCLDPSEKNLYEAIKTGPYGRCVYACDNDVVDHQVVNMSMKNGIVCTLTMSAFTAKGGRQVKIMGTEGEIEADEYENRIVVRRYGHDAQTIDVRSLTDDLSGHGGGDNRLIHDFIAEVSGKEASVCSSTIDRSAESHIMAFAAEYSRLHDGQNVKIEEFLKNEGKCGY